jgi:hypothetical protein
METLTAYLRERAPWPPQQDLVNPFVQIQVDAGSNTEGESTSIKEPTAAVEPAQIRPATDVQAALTVLGRRTETARKQDAVE